MREGIEVVGKWRNEWGKGGICVVGLRGMDAPGTMSRKRNVLSNTTLLSTKHYYNWLMSVEDIASQSSLVFETRYTA